MKMFDLHVVSRKNLATICVRTKSIIKKIVKGRLKVMNNYAELVRLIDVVRAEIEMLEQDYKVHELWSERSNRLNLRIGQLKDKLEHYIVLEEEIRVNIEKLEGLPYKIAKLRFIDDHSYREIADILGHSYSYIRKVACNSNTNQSVIGKYYGNP